MYRIIILLVFVSFTLPTHADVIVEGQVDKSFVFTNLNDFADYDFSITFETYKYDKGYRPAGEVTIPVKQGEEYKPSRGGQAKFSAKHKTTGKSITATEQLGGIELNAGRNVRVIIDKVKITAITDSDIHLEITYGSKNKNGSVKKSGFEGISWWALLPFSVVALAWFIRNVIRRRKSIQSI